MITNKFISAEVVEQTQNIESGATITTFKLSYHRFIHSEVMTHRMFSRNASSSRAVPVETMLKMLREDPVMPLHWGLNQSGMQAKVEASGDVLEQAKDIWLRAASNAADSAEALQLLGIHKQVANRLLEPFVPIKVLITATDWDNFYTLRNHEDAQPEIRVLAQEMLNAVESCKPRIVAPSSSIDNYFMSHKLWHLPFIREEERQMYLPAALIKMSAARCARVSYLNFDGSTANPCKDIELYDQLITSEPMHASPIEHQAMAWKTVRVPTYHFNLRDFKSARWFIEKHGKEVLISN